jgi:hypothetical protein
MRYGPGTARERPELNEVASKLIVVVVVEALEALDGRVLDGAVHSLGLTKGLTPYEFT